MSKEDSTTLSTEETDVSLVGLDKLLRDILRDTSALVLMYYVDILDTDLIESALRCYPRISLTWIATQSNALGLVILASGVGALKAIQWLVSHFNLDAAAVCSNDNEALQIACRNGHAAVAQWLVGTFKISAGAVRECSALAEAVSGGHHDVIRWLTEEFKLTAADYIADDYEVVQRSASSGDAKIVQFVFDTLSAASGELGVEQLWLSDLIEYACRSEKAEAAEWLLNSLSPSEIKRMRVHILRGLQQSGHLTCLARVIDVCELTSERDECYKFAALACRRRPAAAKLVILRAQLNHDDVERNNHRISLISCGYGCLETVKWLTAEFKLTAADARVLHNSALRAACRMQYRAVAQFLVLSVGLTIDDAVEAMARERSHGVVAEWLKGHFNISEDRILAMRQQL